MNRKIIAIAIGLVLLISSAGIVIYMLANGDEKIRVACVGDSITEGTGYPDELWMLLGSNYTVKAFGVGGAAVSSNSENPYMDTYAFQEAKQFQPNIVIVMLGTNDANLQIARNNASFIDDYNTLIGQFEALASKPKIYVATPPPIFSNQTAPNARYLTENVIPAILQAAAQNHLQVIDVNAALAGQGDLFPDGIHPDEQGARLIAQAVYRAIAP